MLKGFYLLAMRQHRRRTGIALTACAAALACSAAAVRAYFTPVSVPTSTAAAPYVARLEDGRLIVTHGGQVFLRTDIDTRSLPQADRDALAQGITLPDAGALSRLLEDYGS